MYLLRCVFLDSFPGWRLVMIRPRWTMGYQINKTDNKMQHRMQWKDLSTSICQQHARQCAFFEFFLGFETVLFCLLTWPAKDDATWVRSDVPSLRQSVLPPSAISESAVPLRPIPCQCFSHLHDEEHINPIWSLAAKHIKTSKHNKRKNVKEWDWTASFYHPQSQGQLQVQKRNQKPPNRTSNTRTHYQKFSWAPANRPIEK